MPRPDRLQRPFRTASASATGRPPGRRAHNEEHGDPNPKRADLPHYGAGETVCKPTLAAIGNAIFDATGVRLRRVPFRDARVLAALKAAKV